MMRNVLVLTGALLLAACGGGGGGSASAPLSSGTSQPASVSPPSAPAQSSTPSTTTTSADVALADRLYKGDARTPAGFNVETRPSGVTGTLSTRHLKNTDFATGPQAMSTTYEVCTNDMAQAIDWSEKLATWNGQYSDMVAVNSDAHMFEIVRVPRADVTAMIRHRVFRCDYLDRSNTDLRNDVGAAGEMNQRPLNADELKELAEYLWQFTAFNNSDSVVESSTGSTSGNNLVHTIRVGQIIRGAAGSCDTVQVSDWTHTMSSIDGSLARSLTVVRTFKVKNSLAGGTEVCSN